MPVEASFGTVVCLILSTPSSSSGFHFSISSASLLEYVFYNNFIEPADLVHVADVFQRQNQDDKDETRTKTQGGEGRIIVHECSDAMYLDLTFIFTGHQQ